MNNYNDVLAQLQVHGLLVESLQVGRLTRCKTEISKERSGWYMLHEMRLDDGGSLLVGSYGIWQGNDNGALKVTLDKQELSNNQKAAIKKRIAEDRKKAEAARKNQAAKAAKRADAAWRDGTPNGEIDYLNKKQIQNHGCRFTKKGAMMIPMLDVAGQIHGLQFILDSEKHKDRIKKTGRNKEYWPGGLIKKGHFHLIGSPRDVLLIAEGYATAASLHAATNLPVAVAFDANNVLPVAEVLKKRYSNVKLIICADDDAFSRCKSCKKPVNVNDGLTCSHCNEPHLKKNTGVNVSSLAAMQLGCQWVAPKFPDEAARFESYCKNQGKLTDFNDLHLKEGLHLVRSQIEFLLDSLNLNAAPSREQSQQGGGDSLYIDPIDTVDELLERFSLVYGRGGQVFDNKEHLLLTLSDMRDACQSREIHRRWHESYERKIVRGEAVGFDPAGEDKNIKCNLWAGWPTEPKSGKCETLLELLEYMCNPDDGGRELYDWVLKWLAYPIQHPGAKMRSTVVVHGPQGTGKNLFFESVMSIYGQYGRTIDQSAIEDKFNDWASRKLFLIADEVVARTDLYHVKNKLKAFITGDWIRINPKNMAAHEERNHVNLVFLSNERMPVVLEEDDRRHAVIWTPVKLSPDFYKDVSAEINNGGIEALHDFLVNLPLGDFNEHTKPPMTQAKADLIELGKDNMYRFYDDWQRGDLDEIQVMPVLSEDLYDLYKTWASKQGVRAAPMNKVIDAIVKRPDVTKARKRFMAGQRRSNPKTFLFPPNAIEMNPGNSEPAWLGKCVEDFREGLKEYKAGNYD